ncbi:MAG TPA: nuclear transport factor 2 family protein [Candidatus Krumholzibacteria bacterium]|nr:nuclear transport factor 2 family protein [Candidatus Krumholzibacteria bacterium]HPD71543.1 nuclear transport factor 2 family protein [Candidatus Krumholzibacteria bacterium]HRY41524.1 nuclear transport factor 2 family protein [Candidatus Krumholzibacteria bacterium]
MSHLFLSLAALAAVVLPAIAADPAVDPAAPPAADVAPLEAALRATEAAFAKTMADRDLAAFTSFLAADAVFFGGESALRGRDAIAAGWAPFFAAETAPFSWAPQDVFVLASGELGLSSGPVYATDGTRVSFFTSTWHREPDGRWLIVLDRGCPPCD